MVIFKTKDSSSYNKDTLNVCYVSTEGNDTNDGLTKETSFLTLSKAINDGFNYIYLDKGTYIGGISVKSKNNIYIILDNAISAPKVIANHSENTLIIK